MKESVIYQEIIREGLQQGIQQGKQSEALSFTMRLLAKRIGTVTPDLQAQIQNLTTCQMEELGEALLDFRDASDLMSWLQNH